MSTMYHLRRRMKRIHFTPYSVLDEDFSDYFGFTSDEVDAILEAAGRTDRADIIKEWYDGYIFGDSYVYSPWDVINYLSTLMKRKDAKPSFKADCGEKIR